MENIPISDELSLDQAVPRKSKYLTKEDVGQGMLVTISHLTMDDVEADDKTERCTILNFHGDLKPLILNQTNKELLKVATGEVTAGGIKEKQVVLFTDATIMFGGKMVGGIRIRKAKEQAPMPDDLSDLPF